MSQPGRGWAEATCLDARDGALLLAPLPHRRSGSLAVGAATTFQVPAPNGLIRFGGRLQEHRTLPVNGVPHDLLPLQVDPGQAEQINRRAHFRVTVTLKGELIAFWQEGGALQERRRPCVVRNLSVGGALLSVGGPAPRGGQRVLLDLALERGRVLRDLTCVVVDSCEEVAPPPLDAQLRVRFHDLPPKSEAQLARTVNQAQLEMLQRGIR